MKNFSDSMTFRTRDLPACSAVSQPTACPSLVVYDYFHIACQFLDFTITEIFVLCVNSCAVDPGFYPACLHP
jgi:hypothetical protein